MKDQLKKLCIKPKGTARVAAVLSAFTNLQTELNLGIQEIEDARDIIADKQIELENQYHALTDTQAQAKSMLSNVQAILPNSVV